MSNNQNIYVERLTATNARLVVPVGFVPSKVIIENVTNGVMIEWTKDMINGAFIKTAAAGTRTFTDNQKLVIAAGETPGATAALTFASNSDGLETFNTVVFENAGASGTSTLVKTGTGTEADPYVYTYSVYDDDSDNDALIALMTGLIGEGLTATGTNATVGSAVARTIPVPNEGIIVLDQDAAVTYDSNYMGFIIGAIADVNDTTTESLIVTAQR